MWSFEFLFYFFKERKMLRLATLASPGGSLADGGEQCKGCEWKKMLSELNEVSATKGLGLSIFSDVVLKRSSLDSCCVCQRLTLG